MPETLGLWILLAVVGSSYSEAAVRLVANIPWPTGTSVHVLTVAPERWPYLGPSPEAAHGLAEVLAGMRQADYAAAAAVAGAVAALLDGHELAVQTDVREGRPSEVILQCAGELLNPSRSAAWRRRSSSTQNALCCWCGEADELGQRSRLRFTYVPKEG